MATLPMNGDHPERANRMRCVCVGLAGTPRACSSPPSCGPAGYVRWDELRVRFSLRAIVRVRPDGRYAMHATKMDEGDGEWVAGTGSPLTARQMPVTVEQWSSDCAKQSMQCHTNGIRDSAPPPAATRHKCARPAGKTNACTRTLSGKRNRRAVNGRHRW